MVTGVALMFVAFGWEFLSVVCNKVPLVIVLVENVVSVLDCVPLSCRVSHKLVARVLSGSV